MEGEAQVTFISAYFTALSGGIPLALIPLGLVVWFKQLGVKDKALTVTSMIIGLVIGCPYMYSQTANQFVAGMPSGDLVGAILGIAVFGIGLGLIASGVYKVGEILAVKSGQASANPPHVG